MSTIRTAVIQHPSATSAAMTLNNTGSADITAATLNGGPLAGFRNRIINGNFDIWQRGTSFTASDYGADRWSHARAGTTHTATRQAFALGQTDVPGEPTYFCRTVVASVAGAGNFAYLGQPIEDVRTFAGQQVTFSFWAKADATKNISVELLQYFGTGGSPSATVDAIGKTKVSIGTSWQKVTVTATVPSISGKTLGTNGNHSLTAIIWFDGGSNFNARTNTLGQQSGTFDIAQVQLEPGPVASPFERRPIGIELALCQRYFQLGSAGWALTTQSNSTIMQVSGILPVVMRAAPVVAQLSANLYGVGNGPNTGAGDYSSTNSTIDLVITGPHSVSRIRLGGLGAAPAANAYYTLITENKFSFSSEL